MKKVIRFFDRLEDKIRGFLSHYPIIYALIAGSAVVLFWRGIWTGADEMGMSSTASIILSLAILLLTGSLVSSFIGSRLILSGLKGEKKLEEKTLEETKEEEKILERIDRRLDKIEEEINGK